MNNLTELVLRIIKGNMKKYILFLFCNVCAIAMFMSILSLSHNTSLNQMDSIISSNVYAPMYLMGLFLCFFIPYTHQLFQTQMQKDYAILLSIGMKNSEMNKCIIIEHGLLACFSIVIGIVFGECLEIILIEIINLMVGLDLEFQFHMEVIQFICVYAFLLFLFSIIIGLFRVKRKNICEQLISTRVSEEKNDRFIFRIIGILCSIFAIIILLVFYKENSNIAFLSLLMMLIGLYLILDNCRVLIDKIRKKHVFWSSDWNYYYKRNIRIVFAVNILFFSMMYLLMMAIVTFPNFANNAILYHPYDIAYTVYDNSDWIPDEDYIANLAKQQQIEVTDGVSLQYINVGGYSIFDIDEVNGMCERDYNCDDNEAIYIYCVVENDGYVHDTNSYPSKLKLNGISVNVSRAECDVLFGKGCGTTDDVILVNHTLFLELAKERAVRTLYAYNFNDYTKTKYIYQQLKSELPEKNQWKGGEYLDIICKELSCENAKQSSEFLLLLLIYDSLLIMFSIYIIIRFKFEIEFENEKHKINLLRSLGSDEKCVKRIIRGKVYGIWGIPFFTAAILILLFSYGTNFTYGYGMIGIWCGVEVIISVMLIIILITFMFYRMLLKRLN